MAESLSEPHFLESEFSLKESSLPSQNKKARAVRHPPSVNVKVSSLGDMQMFDIALGMLLMEFIHQEICSGKEE